MNEEQADAYLTAVKATIERTTLTAPSDRHCRHQLTSTLGVGVGVGVGVEPRRRPAMDEPQRDAHAPPRDVFGGEPDWSLIQQLAHRPHAAISDDFMAKVSAWEQAYGFLGVGEMAGEVRSAHGLLDLLGVPAGHRDSADLDARVWRAVNGALTLQARLGGIAGRHSRVDGLHGALDEYCIECEQMWPCETRQFVDGAYDNTPALTVPAAPEGADR